MTRFEELCEANRRARAEAELADTPLLAHARAGDPDTSHAAARSLAPDALRASLAAILRTFAQYGPMTDEELIAAYRQMPTVPRQSVSGLRTRRSELVELRKVEDSGSRRRLPSGRMAVVWRVL